MRIPPGCGCLLGEGQDRPDRVERIRAVAESVREHGQHRGLGGLVSAGRRREHLHTCRGRLRTETARHEFGRHALRADLVELVEGHERVRLALGRHPCGTEQRAKEPTVIEPHPEVRKSEGGQHVGNRRNHFRFDHRRRRPHQSMAPGRTRGSVHAPGDRHATPAESDSDGSIRECALIFSDHACQRHGQVVAQREIGLARALVLTALKEVLKMSLAPSSPYLPVRVSMFSKAGVSSGSNPYRSYTSRTTPMTYRICGCRPEGSRASRARAVSKASEGFAHVSRR